MSATATADDPRYLDSFVPSDAITPTALKRRRRDYRQALARYRAVRKEALAVCAQYRGNDSGPALIRTEDALNEAIEARFEWHLARRDLAEAEARPCIKGAAVSRTARKRAFREGRMK